MTKRKHISEHLTKSKKNRSKKFKEIQSDCTILEVINLGIPHVGEQIFSSLNTDELIQCLEVSQPWKALGENVLLKRWKGRIIEACKEGNTVIVKILLANLSGRKTELNTREKFGMTAFSWACNKGHREIVKLLLDHSSSKPGKPITKAKVGKAPFYWACDYGHKDVVKLLLDHPGNKNIEFDTMEFGTTAFIRACYNGYKDVVKLLLDYSDIKMINLNAQDINGSSGFMEACRSGHIDVVMQPVWPLTVFKPYVGVP